MSSRAEVRAAGVGRAALAALRGGPARVFAAFERSCYVETDAGIACVGGPAIGRGPLNVVVESGFVPPSAGSRLIMDFNSAMVWKPRLVLGTSRDFPGIAIPESLRELSGPFQRWLEDGAAPSPDDIIGRGPGLTPAGDDFVGGAMIALRAAGKRALADRVAAWALPLAETRTSRISRAHLACAANGEGHEALHGFLRTFSEKHLGRLARIGHSSGLDAAAGALLALNVNIHEDPRSTRTPAIGSSAHLAHLRRT